MSQRERGEYLIRALGRELPQVTLPQLPADEEGQWRLFRALCSLRPPRPVSEEFLQVQDAYLSERVRQRGVVDGQALPATRADGRIVLWQGDITTLKVDAIVNAANAKLLGCFQPLHGCIDNMIHSVAGVQLRLKCQALMAAQGRDEPPGRAKLTPAYNLPCRYVLHTVGPIVFGELTRREEGQLAGCYRACLELAAEHRCRSIAFCCISTGEFRFPPARAAEIAVETVTDFLRAHPGPERVIFNVFQERDLALYRRLLGPDRAV
ncbi:MAG TPA: protein-ADP-ribose hydrolase [Candidatus Enterenecus merdae]|nr:protein-ADP-ribose hydrolase [Candidatus Enterenecus merdae]